MEEEGIGLVLGRATELRLKISNCIHTNTNPNSDDDDATQTLLNISDALQSLETQLSSLQVLQQQQRYEREIALTEIENSRKMLIDRLNEYKGKELEVILEASTFASETVEPNNEYHSRITSVDKSARNGFITHDPMIENEQNHVHHEVKNPSKGLRFLVTLAAKTVFTIVGVVSILSLSGFGANLSKFGIPFNVQGLHSRTGNEKERPTTENEGGRPITRCPPGRVSVVINGEARCLVKERVEIPFSAVATIPDINYGCG